jgi:TRAP transporter TAXI family solute receptor
MGKEFLYQKFLELSRKIVIERKKMLTKKDAFSIVTPFPFIKTKRRAKMGKAYYSMKGGKNMMKSRNSIMANRAKFLILFFCIGLVLSFSTNALAQKKRVTVAGGSIGSTAYVQTAALADLVTKNSKKISLTAQTTKGYVENARLINTGETDFGVCGTTIIYPALQGTEKFKEGKKENLRAVINAGSSVYTFVTYKTKNIKTIKDLAGKRVNIGPPGSNTAYLAELTLKAYGVWDKVNKTQLGFNDAAAALRDGKIDCYNLAGDPPAPAVIETFSAGPGMIIPLEENMRLKIAKEHPVLAPTPVEPNTYQGQKEAIPVMGYQCYLLVNSKVPDWIVNELLSVMMRPDVMDKIILASHKWGELKEKDIPKVESMVKIGLKFHPAAEKYWKEKGVVIPGSISTLK